MFGHPAQIATCWNYGEFGFELGVLVFPQRNYELKQLRFELVFWPNFRR